MDNIDDVMRDVVERERRDSGASSREDREIGSLDYEEEEKSGEAEEQAPDPAVRKVNVGTVEHFFNKINVVAVHLTGTLRIGDTIELQGERGPFRATVLEMQIDKEPVGTASYGDSVGIKVSDTVLEGSDVYLVG